MAFELMYKKTFYVLLYEALGLNSQSICLHMYESQSFPKRQLLILIALCVFAPGEYSLTELTQYHTVNTQNSLSASHLTNDSYLFFAANLFEIPTNTVYENEIAITIVST